jgi:hypothetical protein
MPSLATKQISPDAIRHTTATHLLRAGVDLNTVRAWNTTDIYAEIDLKTKAKAHAMCDVGAAPQPKPRWRKIRVYWHSRAHLSLVMCGNAATTGPRGGAIGNDRRDRDPHTTIRTRYVDLATEGSENTHSTHSISSICA